MTKITYTEGSIIFSGHAGNPIVCHAISAISQMAANYVTDNHWGTVLSADGYLEIRDIDEKYYRNDLFKAMSKALEDIAEEYPRNVKIEYNE